MVCTTEVFTCRCCIRYEVLYSYIRSNNNVDTYTGNTQCEGSRYIYCCTYAIHKVVPITSIIQQQFELRPLVSLDIHQSSQERNIPAVTTPDLLQDLTPAHLGQRTVVVYGIAVAQASMEACVALHTNTQQQPVWRMLENNTAIIYWVLRRRWYISIEDHFGKIDIHRSSVVPDIHPDPQ